MTYYRVGMSSSFCRVSVVPKDQISATPLTNVSSYAKAEEVNGAEMDFLDLSNDQISDCGADEEDLDDYSDGVTDNSRGDDQDAFSPVRGEGRKDDDQDYQFYVDEFKSSSSSFNYDSSDDDEYTVRKKKRPAKRTSGANKRAPAKRTISTAFGKARRPSIKFKSAKKKKRSSAAYNGILDYGDTTTEEDSFSDESIQPAESYNTQNDELEKAPNSRKNLDLLHQITCPEIKDENDIINNPQSVLFGNGPTSIEKVLWYRLGPAAALGKELHQLKWGAEQEIALDNQQNQERAMQFLIKWKQRSYLHCTWESEDSLYQLGVINTKKLQNFCQEHKVDPSNHIDDPMAQMDEHSLAEHNDSLQSLHSVLNEFTQLNYVLSIWPTHIMTELHTLAENNNGVFDCDQMDVDTTKLLCLWTNMPHSDANWEDASLVQQLFPNALNDYFARRAKMYYQLDVRRIGQLRFYKMNATPDFICRCDCEGDTHNKCNMLRDYQLEGVNWLTSSFCRKKSVILADEMGLGKTVQVISFLSTLHHTYGILGPHLIVVPLSTVASWRSHFAKWAPDLIVVGYIGNAESRGLMRKLEFYDNYAENDTLYGGTATGDNDDSSFNVYNAHLKFHVVITTYEMVLKDKEFLGQFDWVSLIVDEAHRLKNQESALYTTLQSLYSNHRLLMTGTPLQNNLRELWCILHFILPDRYSSWDEFEVNFSQVDPKAGYAKLQKEISPYILRRMKKDVEKSLPPKVEQILRVDMTRKQKELYKCILTKNYTQLSKELKCNISGFLNVMMELKKCCNHTSLISPLDLHQSSLQDLLRGGGKLILLDKLLTRFKEDGSRVLVFSQMIMILDILSAYLHKKGYSFQRLDGSVTEIMRKRAMDEFNAPGSKNFCFLLSTRAGGLGINLVSADVVIIFDSDWNPQNDLQAQARAHRIGQTKKVKIYRLVTKGSVDETIVERAKKKMVLDHLVIQTMSRQMTGSFLSAANKPNSISATLDKKDLSNVIKFGAEELFKETNDDEDDKLQQMDIDEILSLAAQNTDSDDVFNARDNNNNQNDAAEDLLSSFKVANFKADDFDDNDDVTGEEDANHKQQLLWDDIIPEKERKRILEEEEISRMAQLYLPPRRRNAVVPEIPPQSSKSKRISKRRRNRGGQSPVDDNEQHSDFNIVSEDDNDHSSDNETHKKPKTLKRQQFITSFPNLTAQDVKKFVASYKKFPSAWERCELVATDALMSNKPIKQVQQLAKWIHTVLAKANPKPKSNTATRRSHKITINNVQMPSADIFEWEKLLMVVSQNVKNLITRKNQKFSSIKIGAITPELFRELYSSMGTAFKGYSFPALVWPSVQWKQQHDSELLLGIFFWGFSNWSAMFEQGLLKNVEEAGLAVSTVSRKLKAHLLSLTDALLQDQVIQESPKPAAVPIKKESDEDDFNESAPPSRRIRKATSTSTSVLQKEPPKRKSSATKTSKKSTSSTSITSFLKPSLSDYSSARHSHSLSSKSVKTEENVKITEIDHLTEEMIEVCGALLKPLKDTISSLEGLFKGKIFDDLTTSSELKQLLTQLGNLVDESLNDHADERFHKVFKSRATMRSILWNFISRFTNATPLQLYQFYRNNPVVT